MQFPESWLREFCNPPLNTQQIADTLPGYLDDNGLAAYFPGLAGSPTLTAYLLTVLSESPLHTRFAGGLLLILPSVLFVFAVRKWLFTVWGISGK